MIFPEWSNESMKKRFQLEPEVGKCEACGRGIPIDRPFVTIDSVGYIEREANHHNNSCGMRNAGRLMMLFTRRELKRRSYD